MRTNMIKPKDNGIRLEHLLFPVRLVKSQSLTGIAANSDYTHAVIGTIDGVDKLLNVCSDRYELIPNTEIFPEIERRLNTANIDYHRTYDMTNHAGFTVKYIIDNEDLAVTVGKSLNPNENDMIFPQIIVNHSYNGLKKYSIMFGYFRLVCSNGLVIPVAEMKHFNLHIIGKHTKQIKKSFDTLFNRINLLLESKEVTKILTEKYQIMANRWVENPKDRLIEVLKASEIIAVENSKFNTVEHIMNIVRGEAGLLYNGKVNDWLIFNGINNYVNDDTLNVKSFEKRVEIDQKVFATMLA